MVEPTYIGSAPDLSGIAGLPDGAVTRFAPAHPNNYSNRGGRERNVIALVVHTPEEPWDDTETAPRLMQGANFGASYHYYIDSDGDLIQLVRESDAAWHVSSNYDRQQGKGIPIWWKNSYGLFENSDGNLGRIYNNVTIGISIEGYAASIGTSMNIASRQFQSLNALVHHLASKHSIPIERQYLPAHAELNNNRSDPGAGFPYEAMIRQVLNSEQRARGAYDLPGAPNFLEVLGYADISLTQARDTLGGQNRRYDSPDAAVRSTAVYSGPGTVQEAYSAATRELRQRRSSEMAKAQPPVQESDALELETTETFAGRFPPRRARMVVRSQQVGRFTPLAIDGRDLRMRFKISYDLDEENKPWEIDVYNLSPENVQRVSELSIGGRFDLAAGYAGEYGLLCGGEIYRIDQLWQPPDRITRFLCGAQDIAMSEIVVSTAWEAEVTILTAIETVARAAGLGVGGVSHVPSLQEQFGRWTSFAGTAKRAISYLANLGDVEWTEFCGLILFSPKFTEEIQRTTPQPVYEAETSTVPAVSDAPTPTHLVSGTGSQLTPGERERAIYEERQRQEAAKAVLNQSLDPSAIVSELHGMIGQPTISEAGIKTKMRLNNGLAPGRLVRLDARVGQGLYRVTTLVHEGDTWQDQFVTTIEAATV